MQQLTRALIDGLRSVFFLRPRVGAFEVGLGVAVTLCALNILAAGAFEYQLSRGHGIFNAPGFAAYLGYFSVLITCLCLGSCIWRGTAPSRLFVGIVALSTVWLTIAAVATTGARFAMPLLTTSAGIDTELLSTVAPLAFFALSIAAMFRMGYGLAERRRFLTGLGVICASVFSTFFLSVPQLFISTDAPPIEFSLLQVAVDALSSSRQQSAQTDVPQRPRIDGEAVMYRQHALTATALDKLQPAPSERGVFYFVAMAAYASQDVFKREVTAVQDLFDQRFETAGRSIVLVNHRDSINDAPLANMTNLDMALQRIGKLMRPDRDALVLFVTSHGTKGEIAVEFPGFPLNTMTPDKLAATLDRAGIVNRVLILSACHSGSFIDRLKGDHTLILTAAHADKTSFGCGNEFAWTYFGDAYFNQALRTETSLIDAFGMATRLIETWEKRDRITASEPQMSVGANIKDKLDAITTGLRITKLQ